MPDINIPLLRKAVEWVEEQDLLTNNRSWFQGSWFASNKSARFELENHILYDDITDEAKAAQIKLIPEFCDTAYCLAGWLAANDGWEPVSYPHAKFGTTYDGTCSKDGATKYAPDVASDLLGIDKDDADYLFDGSRTASEIRDFAEELAGERL